MSEYDFEADRREANRILCRWIEAKTGTTDLQRWAWRMGVHLQKIGETFQQATAAFSKGVKNDHS